MGYLSEWTPELRNALLAPVQEVEFLPKGSGGNGQKMGMPYIDGRAVMTRLDETVGPGGWQFTYSVVSTAPMMVQGILTVLGVTKCDAGEASDEGEKLKSAVSDALKRCAVHFGVGRYLYGLEPCFGTLNQYKKWEKGKEPRISSANLAQALRGVGFVLKTGESLPEVRTVAAPSFDDEPQQTRTAPAPSNGNDPAPESRGDAAASGFGSLWKAGTGATTAPAGGSCPECKAPGGKHATKCSQFVRPGVAH